MKVEIAMNKKIVNEVVEIHLTTFPEFFLTFLGKGFLKQLYSGFIEHNNSNLIIAMNSENKVLGFLAYSNDLSGFYKYLIKKKIIFFAWYSMIAFFKKPKILFRLLRAFSYSKKSERNEKYVEISSIGVEPKNKNLGIGSVMIKKLIENVDFENFEYIKLETDAENNMIANCFYKKNGFDLFSTYETPEKRKMNEYRYYKNNKEKENE